MQHVIGLLTNMNSNVDSHFKDYTYLMFPSKSIHTDGIRAGVMVSFHPSPIAARC